MQTEFKAVVVEVSDEVKSKSNGSTYNVCTVKFLDGNLQGKTYFAQRTLLNKDGVSKKPVNENQEVLVYLQIVDNKPFFEISSGSNSVDSADDIMAALGL
jgi:hypothetical protein